MRLYLLTLGILVGLVCMTLTPHRVVSFITGIFIGYGLSQILFHVYENWRRK